MLSIRAKLKGNKVQLLDRAGISDKKKYQVLITFLGNNVTAFDGLKEKDVVKILGASQFNLSESDVLLLKRAGQGISSPQIAVKLGMSHGQVRNRFTLIYDKLQVKNRSAALLKANEFGLLD